ncbi:hypothetical protein E5C31_11375 [Providencia rettgeri]|nr:hypothetical protein [Providencia rettgeri]
MAAKKSRIYKVEILSGFPIKIWYVAAISAESIYSEAYNWLKPGESIGKVIHLGFAEMSFAPVSPSDWEVSYLLRLGSGEEYIFRRNHWGYHHLTQQFAAATNSLEESLEQARNEPY